MIVMSFVESLAEYGHLWLLESLVLGVLIIAIVLNWRKVLRFVTSHMIAFALVLWATGTVVYAMGFSFDGTARSFPALIFRSMQAALGMFISDNELVEVSEHYKENAIYMTVFALVHFSALFLSAILIFSMIGHRLKSFFSLFIESVAAKRKDRETYLFWGVNAQSVSLATDVRKGSSDARIIFLHHTGENSMGEKLEVSQLLDSGTMNNDDSSYLAMVESVENALLVYVASESSGTGRYASLRRIMEASTDLHFFFMSSNDDLNVSLGKMVATGRQFKIRPEQTIDIHVLTKESVRRDIAEEQMTLMSGQLMNISWSFIDLPSLAVSSLKHYGRLHPVATYPESAIKGGKVDGDFNAWILGFGATGRGMFQFLYEFASFVGKDGEPVQRRFTIFDKEMETSLGNFFGSCPDMLRSGCVEPLNISVGSMDFWSRLRERVDRLNCVCLCLGDDELNLKVAREMYRQIIQFRSSSDRLQTKLYLRVYSSEYEAAVNVFAKEYKAEGIEVIPFGSISGLFTTDIILKKNLKDAFAVFNQRFDAIRGRNLGCSAKECWDRDFNISKYISKYGDLTVALDELRNRTAQCEAETYHIGTMVRLAGIADGDYEGVSRMADIMSGHVGGSLDYPGADKATRALIDVLAESAYLRQKYSHELLGFKAAEEKAVDKDPVVAATKKLTQFVLPWKESSQVTRNMMYSMVDTSFAVAQDFVSRALAAKR